MNIEVLGSYGNRDKDKFTTCFKIDNSILIDAGNIINGIENLSNIKHIFLTHSHLDHIIDIPFFLDKIFPTNQRTINIYGNNETLKAIEEHIFNNTVWPDFHNINILQKNEKTIKFIELKENKSIIINNIEIKPFLADHTVKTFGYLINKKILISGDTALCDNLINTINKYKPPYLIIECSFPNNMQELAQISKHMTPNDIETLIKNLKYTPNKIFIYHIKPNFKHFIIEELKHLDVEILEDNVLIDTKKGTKHNKNIKDIAFEMIKNISSENNLTNILEKIVTYSREITHSDGGSLYIKTEDDKYLQFKIVQNDTLNVNLKEHINWPNLPLYIDGKENKEMVAVLCALSGKVINIEDVYDAKEFNFEGTRKFDKHNNYRSKSMLVIPLRNHEHEIIGVLQLINKKLNDTIISFSKQDEEIVTFLASIAAISITKNKLIEDFEKLLNSLIKTIGIAIDRKSKYTGGHVKKVSELAVMIAKALQKESVKQYSENELQMIEIAGWLHDIGKITTPVYVMDKATKLEKFTDTIETVKYKFEILKKEYYIQYLKNEISKEEYENKIKKADEDFEFLKELNKGSEFVSNKKLKRLQQIASIKINNEPILNAEEYKDLSVRKGTLTEEEMQIMRNHAAIGLEMLNNLHFPKKFKRLPEIAANHHEKLNGKGYPRGLSAKDLSTEERLMTIADIFEALSASDRPYKEPKKLSEIFRILYFMTKNNELDKEIIKIFIKTKAYLEYAKKELKSEQIDEIPTTILDYFLN